MRLLLLSLLAAPLAAQSRSIEVELFGLTRLGQTWFIEAFHSSLKDRD